MSRRLRITLAIIGIVLILISFAVLAYAFWPQASTNQLLPLPSDLFSQPEASLPWPWLIA